MRMCRTLLAREHKRIRAEYEERVKQLEQERQGVEEERVQVSGIVFLLHGILLGLVAIHTVPVCQANSTKAGGC